MNALETDNFTLRNQPTRESIALIDDFMQQAIQKAARKGTDLYGRCNPDHVYRSLLKSVAGYPSTGISRWVSRNSAIQKQNVSVHESVYGGKAPISGVMGVLVPSIRLNGQFVGMDKLSHFTRQGWDYFQNSGRSIAGFPKAFHAGLMKEKSLFGKTTTGVFSWGDMAANYYGFHFWNRILSTESPYLRCVKDKRGRGEHYEVQPYGFTFKDYVNESWDEALNCSDLVPSLNKTVRRNLSKLNMTCPVEATVCSKMRALTGAEYFVTPKCMTEKRDEQSVETQGGSQSVDGTRSVRHHE